jgi:putative transposase
MSVLVSLVLTLRGCARSYATLQLELLAARHQLQVLERSRRCRPRLFRADRLLSVWLSHVWHDWRSANVIVRPETVIAWHRRGFRLFWRWKSRRRLGRATVPADVRTLIRKMSDANPLRGAPRVHGELLKLGIDVCAASSRRPTHRTICKDRHRRGGRDRRGVIRVDPGVHALARRQLGARRPQRLWT